MKTSHVLGEMLDRLTPETWVQGRLIGPGDSACLVGHAQYCSGVIKRPNSTGFVSFSTGAYIRRLYVDVLRLLEKHMPEGYDSLPDFNDDSSTSFEDISLVVKKAYEDALEHGI